MTVAKPDRDGTVRFVPSDPSTSEKPVRTRKFAASTAPRPHVAEDIARTAAACRATVEVCAPAEGGHLPQLSLTETVASVCADISQRTDGPLDRHVDQALHAHADAVIAARIKAADTAFAAAAGTPGVSLLQPAQQLAALQRLGLTIVDLSPQQLAPLRRHHVVRALEALHDAQHRQRWISDQHLSATIARAWQDTTCPGNVAAQVDELVHAGIDGERLLAAVVNYHSHQQRRLIWHEITKLRRTYPDWEKEDLFGWGWGGLRTALRKYDPDLDNAFSTYAYYRINGAIRDGVRSENPIPKRLTTFLRKVNSAEDTLTQQLGRAPDLAELAAHLGTEQGYLRTILPRLSPTASLDERAAGSDRPHEPTSLIDEHDPADDAIASVLRDRVEQALARLPVEEATAVRLLTLEGRSPGEAAAMAGSSARQLRTRERKGLAALRTDLADWSDDAVSAA